MSQDLLKSQIRLVLNEAGDLFVNALRNRLHHLPKSPHDWSFPYASGADSPMWDQISYKVNGDNIDIFVLAYMLNLNEGHQPGHYVPIKALLQFIKKRNIKAKLDANDQAILNNMAANLAKIDAALAKMKNPKTLTYQRKVRVRAKQAASIARYKTDLQSTLAYRIQAGIYARGTKPRWFIEDTATDANVQLSRFFGIQIADIIQGEINSHLIT